MGTTPRRIISSQEALRSLWRKNPQPRLGWPHRMRNNAESGNEENPVSAGKSER